MKTIIDFLPQVEKALSYADTYDAQELAREVLEGRAQLWQEGEGLLITQLDYKPREVILRFWVAAGEMEDVLALAEKAYEWGREIGCRRAVFVGRKGWEKPLATHGWEADKRLAIFEKEL